ncbi:MAG: prephenate dehydrogenase [Candidatus Binatia bacterium]|nr:MAG: prephenate dehydrogenase [Candidatus Binatia bacterium]
MGAVAERMLVAGVGLVGGSLALAARRGGLVGEVVGWGRTAENLEKARALGIVDRVERDLARAARGADLVVLAVPVRAMPEVANCVGAAAGSGAVVTDVGSVKGSLVSQLEERLGSRFVGGHPIAGTEKSGPGAARADLFEGKICVLTPTRRTSSEALEKVRALWEGVGARVRLLDPEEHDRALAWTSHLPHLFAYALVSRCPAAYREFAGPSFGDATRVASSAAEIWRDIFAANARFLAEAWESVVAEAEKFLGLADRGAVEELGAELERARRKKSDATGT